MGRIRTQQIKSAGEKMFQQNQEKFSTEFEENKEAVEEIADINSKKIRNKLAGFLVKRVKKEQKLP